MGSTIIFVVDYSEAILIELRIEAKFLPYEGKKGLRQLQVFFRLHRKSHNF